MEITNNKITIKLEENDIDTFWNVVMFALDKNAKEHCMTEDEEKMAKKLADATKGQ